MAIQIIQNPFYTSAGQGRPYPIFSKQRVIYGVNQTSDMSANFKFRLILKIYKGTTSGTLVATIKQGYNGYESSAGVDFRSFFDIKDILASFLSFTTKDPNTTQPNVVSIHQLGQGDSTKPFGESNNIMVRFTVRGSCEFSTTQNGIPTEDASFATNNQHFWNATFNQPPYVSQDNYAIDADIYTAFYNPGDANKLLFSSATIMGQVDSRYNFSTMSSSGNSIDLRENTDKIIQFVNPDDYHTITFKGLDGGAQFVRIRLYRSNGETVGSFENSTANGGSGTASTDDSKRVIHFGCGPANIKAQTLDNTIKNAIANNDYLYYEIALFDDGSYTTQGTKFYYFVNGLYAQNKKSCNPYNPNYNTSVNLSNKNYVRLGWINNLGGWDYYNFALVNTSTLELRNKNVKRTPSGKFTGEYYEQGDLDINTLTLGQEVKMLMNLNTGFIDEGESRYLETLFASPLIHYIPFNVSESVSTVMIKNTTYKRQNVYNDNLQTNISFDIEFSNNQASVSR